MNKIKELAEQAGFVLWYGAERRYRAGQIAVDWASNYDDELEKFAELVRADEREACAKVCDDIDAEYNSEDVLATWCAEAIRARGEK